MPQHLQPCPHCKQTLDLTPLPQGQIVSCPYCHQMFSVGGAVPPAIPPVPVAQTAGVALVPPRASNPLATISLLTGIFFFVLLIVDVVVAVASSRTGSDSVLGRVVGILGILCALTALVTGILGIRKTRDGIHGGKGMAIAGTSLGGVAILLVGAGLLIAVPAMGKVRGAATRVQCASQLRMLGMGVMMYANDHKGYLPPNIKALCAGNYVKPQELVCPATGHTPAPGSTRAQQAANLTPGRHLSYTYLGKGQRLSQIRSPALHVLAYEPLTDHSDGINVLFADGHVEWFIAARAAKIISEVQSGQNPPPTVKAW